MVRPETFGPYYVLIIIISIQPEGRFWQEPEPSQATGMALAHCNNSNNAMKEVI